MDYEENMENARYAMNDDTPWSSDTVIDLIVEGRNRRVVLIKIIT
jgi:hypothetical protein